LRDFSWLTFQFHSDVRVVRFESEDGCNRLSRACVTELTEAIREWALDDHPLIIAGNGDFFSVGADLKEIASLTGPAAYEFSKLGQDLMRSIEEFPAPVLAAISGYCMGGGLDLALACHKRIAAPNALFGHRGAALGLMTGWGGTQRLPRLIGKARTLEMFVTAEMLTAAQALYIGLVDKIADDPVAEAVQIVRTSIR
jgi:enoyl-CoA hydratase/carnithine racemase